MQNPSSRFVIVISGLLTLLVLGGGMLTLALHNGWLQVAPATTPGQAQQDEVALYRGKLEDAYRSLDEAYAQVRALQSAQSQVSGREGRERGEREGREHASGERHESRRRHEGRDGHGERRHDGHDRGSSHRDADND